MNYKFDAEKTMTEAWLFFYKKIHFTILIQQNVLILPSSKLPFF